MNKLTYLILIATLTVTLTACSDKASNEKVYTKQWYIDNKAEQLEKIKECSNNPGELKDTPNCRNAVAASLYADFSKF